MNASGSNDTSGATTAPSASGQDSGQDRLADRVIVITGAASGLGRAWVQGFVADGATVVAADIDAKGLDALRVSAPQRLHGIVTDVSDADQVRRMVAFALERCGRIDGLFNNAGIGLNRSLEEAPEGHFERHVAVHLFGCIYGMRAVLPVMRAQGYGRIINTVSRSAANDQPRMGAYAAAKAGMWAASRTQARELAGTDILVNMLIPGPTNTAIWGRDRPELQAPEVSYPTARMLATLPAGGPAGKVFWNEKEYRLMGADLP